MDKKNSHCPLCNHQGEKFYQDMFFRCTNCKAIYIANALLLNPSEEKKRYEQHNNDVMDVGYQNFVSPITKAVLRDYTTNSFGLDFGSGTGPVISKLLSDKGYSLKQYDPFFNDDKKLLEDKYDYIVCCEVIEHLHTPAKEFALLEKLLKPNGRLYCMTQPYKEEIDFGSWHYRNDSTHVFFYQELTFQKIKDMYDFSSVIIDDRLITYVRNDY